MTTILIRADASPSIGMGHAMRCLALAQAWIDGGADVHWLAAELLAPALDRLRAEGIHVALEGEAVYEQEDADRTERVAERLGADWVVLDGYTFGGLHQAALRRAGRRVLIVDDSGCAAAYTADIVLNQNVYADEALYAGRGKGALFLLGPRHALLRREFREASPARVVPAEVMKLLVILGGAGNTAAERIVVDALRRLAPQWRFQTRLVLGSSVNSEDVDLGGTEGSLAVSRHLADMPAALAWADLAVSAAGSTVYELMRMGVPSLLIVVAENQRPVARKLHETGVAVNLGPADSLSAITLAHALEALAADQEKRRSMSEKGQASVDGQGAVRVRKVMQAGLLRLRPMREDDMRMTWEWANDPEARAVSFSSAPIPWEDHVRWFTARLGNPGHRMFLAEAPSGAPVGTVRFELTGGHAVISVSIDANARGEGYGRWLIRLGTLEILRATGVSEVHAYIKRENLASIRAFVSAGFRFHSHTVVRDLPAQLFTFTEGSA